VPKECAVEFECCGTTVRVGGMAKGSGMIAPNMATMLAFVTTDIAIAAPVLDKALRRAVDLSFHALTVDGDTSTSDQCLVLASGVASNPVLESTDGPDYEVFLAALTEVCVDLARRIARDGEGATKLATVTVCGALSEADARQVAKTIAESPLVKTALYGNDPNWGRLMAAAGRAGIEFDPARASASLAGVEVFRDGVPALFDKAVLSAAMRVDELPILVDLGTGGAGRFTFFTCDFSYDYVRINAEYTT
jgi:glutamate N-acetyltransferase/amino-acid N-acetyltransferase